MPIAIPNIGAIGAERRRKLGYFWALVALVAVIVMQIEGTSRASTVLLMIPITLAGIGFFQASEMTCVALCAVGKREPSAGDPTLAPEELSIVRRQAVRVIAKSIAASIVLTSMIYLAWPN